MLLVRDLTDTRSFSLPSFLCHQREKKSAKRTLSSGSASFGANFLVRFFHSRGGLSQVIAAAGKFLRRNEQACSNIFHLHLHKMTEASRLSKAFDDYSVTSRIKPASLLLIDTKFM